MHEALTKKYRLSYVSKVGVINTSIQCDESQQFLPTSAIHPATLTMIDPSLPRMSKDLCRSVSTWYLVPFSQPKPLGWGPLSLFSGWFVAVGSWRGPPQVAHAEDVIG